MPQVPVIFLLIGLAGFGAYYGGKEVATGVKHIAHKTHCVLKGGCPKPTVPHVSPNDPGDTYKTLR